MHSNKYTEIAYFKNIFIIYILYYSSSYMPRRGLGLQTLDLSHSFVHTARVLSSTYSIYTVQYTLYIIYKLYTND